MKKPSSRTLAVAAPAALLAGGFIWVVGTQGPLAPVTVTVAQAQEAALPRAVFGVGTVEARRSYSIGPTAAGRVARVLVDQGDAVTASQLLAEMDPVDLDDRLRAAAAAAARADQLVRVAAASLVEARSRAGLAQASADRYADLRRRNFVSAEALDTKRHEAAAATAAAAAAEAALAAARDDAARTAAERAGSARSRAQLRLTSPVAGIVAARLAEPGTTLVAGQAVLQLVARDGLWVRTRIDQGRAAGVTTGLPATVALRSRPGQPLVGRVERVDLLGDAVAEETIANVAFDAAPADLVVGELAEVDIRLPPVPRALTVPAAAVKQVGRGASVWRYESGRVVLRPVRTGAIGSDGRVQIVDGLAAGDAVVVHSSRALAQDLRVKAVDALVRDGS